MPAEAGIDPDVLLLQATLLVHGGKLAAAAEVCRVLLAGDEMNAGANYVLALCFEGVGDRAAATHHYRVASYLDPNFAMPRLHLGLLARRGGEMATAKEDLTQALDLLRREDASRLLLFGGGFTRDALIALCEAELKRCGARA
jgi:chemotaxis protein methyltransferase CheR